MRDNQRARVYRAEIAAFYQSTKNIPAMSLTEVRGRVTRITGSVWWLKHGGSTIEVRDGRGRGRCGASHGYITMPRWGRFWWPILHELTHALNIQARHSQAFCRLYLEMVSRFKGKAEAEALRLSFVKHNVAH